MNVAETGQRSKGGWAASVDGARLFHVAVFYVANALAALMLANGDVQWPAMLPSFLVTGLVFLRLRLCDAAAEHQRRTGLRIAAAFAVAEAALAATGGLPALTAWAVVLLYSLARYHMDAAQPWLRRHRWLEAAARGEAAGWLGLYVAAAATDLHLWQLPLGVWGFAFVNWAVFGLAEFARRPGDMEQARPWRMAIASLAIAALAAFAAHRLILRTGVPAAAARVAGATAAIPALVAVAYVCRPQNATARLFRGTMTHFGTAYYATLILCILF